MQWYMVATYIENCGNANQYICTKYIFTEKSDFRHQVAVFLLTKKWSMITKHESNYQLILHIIYYI